MVERVDLVVVGAGIQGAGVAQAAAAAGYRVVLLEQTGIASGTSSRSSKLIHGGLRYLESAQIRLVYECLRERATLLRVAPDLVHLTPHYLPVYRTTRRRPLQLRLGLSLYALLGGLVPSVRFQSLPRSQWAQLDGLRQTDLQAVFQYYDAQTDDAALTAAVVRSATTLGARLLMPAQLLAAEHMNDCMRLRYSDAQGEQKLECSVLVNAAGPWVSDVLQRILPAEPVLPIDLVAGTHIVLPATFSHAVFYAEAPRDGRAVFIMPWQNGTTLIGTTERLYRGDPAQIAPTQAEIDYLLETVRHYFPAAHAIQPCHAFAGLRVLPQASGAAFGRSRDTQLHLTHAARVLSVYGGKLTAYRSTADRVLRLLRKQLPSRRTIADTTQLVLR